MPIPLRSMESFMFKQFLISLIIFQLIIPMSTMAACPTGSYLSQDGGRCIKSAETLASENKRDECADAADPQACLNERAAADLGDDSSVYKCREKFKNIASASERDKKIKRCMRRNSSGFKAAGQVVLYTSIILLSAYVISFWAMKKKMTCNPPSMYLLSGGAASLLLGEIIAFKKYNEELDKMKNHIASLEGDQTEMTSEEGASSTSQNTLMKNHTKIAYDTLIMQEEAFLKATETRETAYGIATGAFAAATISATTEVILLKASKAGNNDKVQKMLICQKKTEAQQEEAEEKRDSKGGRDILGKISSGIGILQAVPSLLGLFSGKNNNTSSFISPEQTKLYYTLLEKNPSPKDFSIFPQEQQGELTALNKAQSLAELNALVEERNSFDNGTKLSSPSLVKYEEEKKLSFLMDQDSFQSMKKSLIIASAFKGQLELIALLGASEGITQTSMKSIEDMLKI